MGIAQGVMKILLLSFKYKKEGAKENTKPGGTHGGIKKVDSRWCLGKSS